MAGYWDTACLLKLYCAEEDSARYIDLVEASEEPPVTSALTRTEIYFAFQQKFQRAETSGQTPGALFAVFREDVRKGRIFLVPLGEDVLAEARTLARKCYAAAAPVFLRSLDGIHLASARLMHCQQVHSTDARMNQAIEILRQV